MNFDQIKEKYAYHHTSYARGYHTVKEDTIEPYNGRFGKGYKVHYHANNTAQFHMVSYYIEKYIFNSLTKEQINIAINHADIPISSLCCDKLKKEPFKTYEKVYGVHPFIATLATESILRENAWLQNGCNAFNAKRITSKPLSIWTEQDILKYIKINNVKICKIYGDIKENEKGLYLTGLQRTGCMFCLFGIHKEKSPNRFELMKYNYPNIYDYCLNKLGYKKVFDLLNINY